MLVANGPRPFHRGGPDNAWSSFAVSLGATVALFVLAFGAMRSVRLWSDSDRVRDRATTLIVDLPPLVLPSARVPPPVPQTTTPIRPAPSQAVASPNVPASEATPLVRVQPAVIAPPTTVPSSIGSPRDSSIAAANAAIDAARRAVGPAPMTSKGGAFVAPAGVTIHSQTRISPFLRDSIAQASMRDIPLLARTHLPTGDIRSELETSQRQADQLRRRASTSGNAAGVTILQGKGKDGVGAVSGPGMVSIPFPLFSPGPSPEERKRNEAIDAEVQLRLRRLHDRMLMQQDSARADSLRRDSLANRRPRPSAP